MKHLLWTTIALAALAVACGDDGDDTTGSGGSTTTGTTNTGGGTSSGGGGTGGTTSTTGGGGTGGDATGGGGAAPMATVPCAGSECAPGEVCCFDNVSTTQVRCDQPGACDQGHIELSCDHPDDCGAGATCCSAFDGMVQTMVCQATCDAADEFVMCSGPDQDACPMGTTCSNAQAGMGYHYCAN